MFGFNKKETSEKDIKLLEQEIKELNELNNRLLNSKNDHYDIFIEKPSTPMNMTILASLIVVLNKIENKLKKTMDLIKNYYSKKDIVKSNKALEIIGEIEEKIEEIKYKLDHKKYEGYGSVDQDVNSVINGMDALMDDLKLLVDEEMRAA